MSAVSIKYECWEPQKKLHSFSGPSVFLSYWKAIGEMYRIFVVNKLL